MRPRAVVAEDATDSDIDFSSISLRTLKSEAQAGFEAGLLDDNSFFTILEGLPSQAVEPSGRVVDYGAVGEDSLFDYRSYYENQYAVAQSLGDPASAQVLASIIAFMERRQGRR